MKKTITIALLILSLCVLGCSCSKKAGKVSGEVVQTPQDQTASSTDPDKTSPSEDQETPNEFYETISSMHTRPIAVMIDNDGNSSRPHAGLEKAYMLYEMVVEGSATRIMALFNDYEVKQVGPVRSSRHYFLDFALENNAIYAHYGFSPKAQSDIQTLGVNNINGLYEDCFWRDNTYDRTYHNAYTSTEVLLKRAKDKNYPTDYDGVPFSYNKIMKTPDGGETGEHLSIAYAGFYQVDYDFDQEKELYFRKINHADHPTWSGEKLSVANIIVIRVTNVDLKDGENKGRQDLYDTGTGTGWYLTEGKVYEITWEKATRTSHSIYAYKDTGEEIVLNPGVTWVQVVGNSIAVDIK